MSVVEVFAIFGPTAAGKTEVGGLLAGRLGTEVVSADAMQVYHGLPLLTNQPAQPTRLVAFRSLVEEMSVGEYAGLAHAEIDELVAATGSAVVVGGTGLYMRAALTDMQVPPRVPSDVRDSIDGQYEADPDAVYAELERIDARAAAAVHRNDRRRVVRAVELARTGMSLTPAESRLWSAETRRSTLMVGIEVPDDVLEARIVARTTAMFERGVAEEVRAARSQPISKTAAKTLGLAEIASLTGDEARARIIVRTRQYAAYQRKWMRRIAGILIVDGTRPAREVIDEILEVARTR